MGSPPMTKCSKTRLATRYLQRFFKTDITYPTLSDRQVIDSVVRHITGGWHQTSAKYHVPSRWISTTARYDWAVWEMSRRLSSGQVAEVSITTIPKRLSYSKRYRGTRLIGVDALPYLINEGYDLRDKSVQFARSSTEILWYGRIFQKHVSKHEIWTREVSTSWSAMIRLRIDDPARMLLPDEYLIPEEERQSDRWIDNLVWDPKHDSWYEASDKISDRIMEIEEADEDYWY
jgi:hypothetical protein